MHTNRSSARHFSFTSDWHLDAAPERVRDVLVDLEFYPQWWRQVRAVATLGPDDARVLIRSLLPYTLDLVLHAVSRDLPVLRIEMDGHLRGWAQWRLRGHGTGTAMRFEQDVELTMLPTAMVAAARPLLRFNHQRMMSGCRDGLLRRLAEQAELRSAGPGD